ncbi:methyl-accepting chemotaxis sensory transducer [Kalymmatonema gypsitolerans NIES-4073]|nr:methyl-accepting chemotaxis sensory transducer [Scytonema sp. NIES-4073]
MAASIKDCEQIYQQAYKAYVQGNYQQAATLIDQVVQDLPDDPNIRLLRGHVYYILQQYEVAKAEYQKVLEFTDDQELISLAQNGIDKIKKYQGEVDAVVVEKDDDENKNFSDSFEPQAQQQELEDLAHYQDFNSNSFDLNSLDKHQDADDVELPVSSPFEQPRNDRTVSGTSHSKENFSDNPFAVNQQEASKLSHASHGKTQAELELPNFWLGHISQQSLQKEENNTNSANTNSEIKQQNSSPAFALDLQTNSSLENKSSTLSENNSPGNNIEFLEDFDEFDDLGNIPGFDLTADSRFQDSQMRSASVENNGKLLSTVETVPSGENGNFTSKSNPKHDDATLPTVKGIGAEGELPHRHSELFTLTTFQQGETVFTQADASKIKPQSIKQGFLAPLENASLQTKQWIVAGTVGVVSAVVVAGVSFVAANLSPPEQRESMQNTGWAIALTAGITSFATTGIMGNLAHRQIRRTARDLQAQFDAVRQGNFNVQATVSSQDEFGQLAASFNEMSHVIFTTTNEATRKAQELESARVNLQRQVIRLLDDVEGAARGDLTVQAEVSADVLGAIADAFNLTIQNLRDLVQQVKVAAQEVTRGATNSEIFARALSSDALRQAEELGVTLNSVQIMTDSIQRVAEAAREAEAVTREASDIAVQGGEAVENTVAGILEIRQTVAQTTRKVKRLAESSQEISKIVALVSQIASRTNLLALNASIEAARAGSAGRGFAIVADEVRQLADKSAKSLKEIEQIVMQIQSDTGSVMTAMEEGTQQVIKGTKLAEQAKRSLENIIQVAKRIDILVRGITSDTVEQTKTSRTVTIVMQSVELTAQDTSLEAQRVSGALQNLVSVSGDLITSVERFRVETAENTK